MAKQVPPEIRWDGPAAVRLAHQREPSREIILIANPGGASIHGKLACVFGGNVSIWNPETGGIIDAGQLKRGEALAVAVPADSARFVVFERSDRKNAEEGSKDGQAVLSLICREGCLNARHDGLSLRL